MLKNFYTDKAIDKKKYHNPAFKQHGIDVPFRMIICGNSGSKKTNTLMNLISVMDKTFQKIFVCVPNPDEPLYTLLRKKIPSEDQLTFYTDMSDINLKEIEEKEQWKQILFVIDDMVSESEKKHKPVIDMFKAGRKLCDGISVCYISQSYFNIPKFIRNQATYILLLKITDSRDLSGIMKRYSTIGKEQLLRLFNYATSVSGDFLLIDASAPPEKAFRKNFLEILKVD